MRSAASSGSTIDTAGCASRAMSYPSSNDPSARRSMMAFFGLHHQARHRARQMRWVLPIVGLLAAATLVTLIVQFQVSSQDVGTEFFHAHKTISNTSQLLIRGTVIGGAILALLVVAVAIWALHMTHRIVRPVHTLHRALDALVAGDLGVRVAL